MYNLKEETDVPPKLTKYASYVKDGTDFNNSTNPKLKHINGVKGVWAFDILPYANLIWMTKVRTCHVVCVVLCCNMFIFSRCLHVAHMLCTCCLHAVYSLLHVVYMSLTCYLHVAYM